jgi:hypothetical protein
MIRGLARAFGLALIVIVMGATASNAQTSISVAVGSPGTQIDISYFYDNLSSDGEWFRDPNRGWCWTPYDVTADWRPYYDGNWQYTDDGWSWASNESFGWATYHYGRWFFDDSYGWAWQPGDEWAPAWVAWRTGDDYIGWAPLPPRANWDATAGLSFADADANAIPSHEWAFVPRRHLLDISLSLQVTSVARNVTLLGRSHDATRYEVREGRPANFGLDVAQFEVTLGHPVPRVRIVDADTPDHARSRTGGNGVIGFFRPRIEPMPATQVPPPAMAGRRNPIPEADMQRQRDERSRKLESDLVAERARLTREHENETRGQVPGAVADETRKRQADEQQAFEAHAQQQRQVFAQRMQKQVVRPEKAAKPGKGNGRQDNPGNGKGKGHDKGGQ